MEGNRDEAEKCINIATKAFEVGDKEKALKFLNKAEKLYPTDRAKGNDFFWLTSGRASRRVADGQTTPCCT